MKIFTISLSFKFLSCFARIFQNSLQVQFLFNLISANIASKLFLFRTDNSILRVPIENIVKNHLLKNFCIFIFKKILWILWEFHMMYFDYVTLTPSLGPPDQSYPTTNFMPSNFFNSTIHLLLFVMSIYIGVLGHPPEQYWPTKSYNLKENWFSLLEKTLPVHSSSVMAQGSWILSHTKL